MILLLITFVTRFLIFLQTKMITNDGVVYIQMAKQFSEGKFEGISGTYFNLYPFLIFFVNKFVGDWELSGQIISFIFSTLTVIPIFLLGRSLFSEKIGWISSIFYMILPNFLRYSADVLREPLSWFLIANTILLVWVGIKKGSLITFGVASISAALGAMTRVEGSIIWIILTIFIALRKGQGLSLKKRIAQVIFFIFLCPMILILLSFFARLGSEKIAIKEMSTFSINTVLSNIYTSIRPGDPIGRINTEVYKKLPPLTQDALELARRHRIVLAISEVIYKFIKSSNLIIFLIIFGLWKRRKDGFESSDWYLIYLIIALFGMSVFYTRQSYYFSTRHGLMIVLPFLYFGAHGLDFLSELFNRAKDKTYLKRMVISRYLLHVIILLLLLFFFIKGLSPIRADKVNIKETGLWLKKNGYSGSVIMGSKEFIRLAFYTDGKFLEIPDSWEKVIEKVSQNGVRIIVIDTCSIEREFPTFYSDLKNIKLSLLKSFKGQGRECFIEVFRVN